MYSKHTVLHSNTFVFSAVLSNSAPAPLSQLLVRLWPYSSESVKFHQISLTWCFSYSQSSSCQPSKSSLIFFPSVFYILIFIFLYLITAICLSVSFIHSILFPFLIPTIAFSIRQVKSNLIYFHALPTKLLCKKKNILLTGTKTTCFHSFIHLSIKPFIHPSTSPHFFTRNSSPPQWVQVLSITHTQIHIQYGFKHTNFEVQDFIRSKPQEGRWRIRDKRAAWSRACVSSSMGDSWWVGVACCQQALALMLWLQRLRRAGVQNSGSYSCSYRVFFLSRVLSECKVHQGADGVFMDGMN